MCNTSYKSCVNRYIKQNSIYITCVIIDISHSVNRYIKQNSIYIKMCTTRYKSCVNRYIRQNSIYITCIILDISHVSIYILSRIASTLQV